MSLDKFYCDIFSRREMHSDLERATIIHQELQERLGEGGKGEGGGQVRAGEGD